MAGNRWFGGSGSAGNPGGADFEPAHAVPHLPDSGDDLCAAVLLVDIAESWPERVALIGAMGRVLRRDGHGGAVQFLGKLSSAGLSAPFARNGGELRGKHR